MWRTIQMWWLIKRVASVCEKYELSDSPSISTYIGDKEFTESLAPYNQRKQRRYAHLLNSAKTQNFIKHGSHCHHCHSTTIHLTTKGFEFSGVFDLLEHLLTKYAKAWTFIVLPVVAAYAAAEFNWIPTVFRWLHLIP